MLDLETKVVIIRHGNTFLSDEKPRRVGGRTDIDLVPSGISQAKDLGNYLQKENIIPDAFYSAGLKRTLQTAHYLLTSMGLKNVPPIRINTLFNEIDYGPDENLPENVVESRIGKEALELWDKKGIPPQGWNVNPLEIISSWTCFLNNCYTLRSGKTTFIVTSNGIARFIPSLLNPIQALDIKLKTGSFALLIHTKEGWKIDRWNERPTI